MRSRLLTPLFVAALLISVGQSTAPAAPAPPVQSRAALIVDTGQTVKKVCLRFRAPSVAALAVLQRASVDSKTTTFAGTGVAVCSLCGTGCPADSTCLTCGGEQYWSYWRAGNGTPSYTYSDKGVGSQRVRDGDVEAWRWGDGKAPPPYASVASVCDDPEAATVDLSASSAARPSTDPDKPSSATPAQLAGFAAIMAAVVLAGGVSRRRRRRADGRG